MWPQAYAYPATMRPTRDWLRRRLHLVRQRAEGCYLDNILEFCLRLLCAGVPALGSYLRLQQRELSR